MSLLLKTFTPPDLSKLRASNAAINSAFFILAGSMSTSAASASAAAAVAASSCQHGDSREIRQIVAMYGIYPPT
jgi:hypothetical protein